MPSPSLPVCWLFSVVREFFARNNLADALLFILLIDGLAQPGVYRVHARLFSSLYLFVLLYIAKRDVITRWALLLQGNSSFRFGRKFRYQLSSLSRGPGGAKLCFVAGQSLTAPAYRSVHLLFLTHPHYFREGILHSFRFSLLPGWGHLRELFAGRWDASADKGFC